MENDNPCPCDNCGRPACNNIYSLCWECLEMLEEVERGQPVPEEDE